MNKSKIEFVREGETAEVNGHQIKGPGTVIRKAVIMEGSICVFGALNNCKTEKFENVLARFNERTDNMSEKTTLTLETFKAEHAELHTQIFNAGIAEGESKERALFKSLKEVCGDDAALLSEMFEQGKTTEEALKEKNTRLQAQVDSLKANPPQQTKKVDPAEQEFTDEQKAGKKTDAGKSQDDWKTEFELSEDLKKEFGDVKAYIAYKRAEKEGRIRGKVN